MNGYIVLGVGKPMEWVDDRYNYGFYFGRVATVFKDLATVKRRIEAEKRETGGPPMMFKYRIMRATEEVK